MAIISKNKRKPMGNTWDRLRKADFQTSCGLARFEQFNGELYLEVVKRKGGFIQPIGYKEQVAEKRRHEAASKGESE